MEQENAAKSGSFKSTVNLSVTLAEIFSLPLEVLMHDRIGARFIRIRGAIAAIVVTAFAALFAARYAVWPLMLFLLLFWARCIAHGVIWQLRLRRREPLGGETTYFPGYPLLCHWLPNVPQQYLRWAEVGISFVFGFLVSFVNTPLGAYLIFASFGLTLTLYLRYQAVLNRILDMHDAVVVQKGVAEGFRERTGG